MDSNMTMSVDEIDTVVQAVVAQKMYFTILKNMKLTAPRNCHESVCINDKNKIIIILRHD